MKINPDGSWIGSQDTTCNVNCECGGELFIGESNITRCKCGKGYRTQFDLVQYEIDETDPEHKEQSDIDKELEIKEIEQSVHFTGYDIPNKKSFYICGKCKGNIDYGKLSDAGASGKIYRCPSCNEFLHGAYRGFYKRK